MGDGLFSPLPIRRTSDLGKLIMALEVPDCKCKPEPHCMAGERDYPEVCPGPSECKDCPLKACPCVPKAEHNLSLQEWHELLHAYDSVGYSEPPPPPIPAVALTKETQLAVFITRTHAGYGLTHPEDQFKAGEDFDHLSILGLKRLRQGGVLATYHEGDSDETLQQRSHLSRKVNQEDKIAVRSLEFDRAAARAAENLGKGVNHD